MKIKEFALAGKARLERAHAIQCADPLLHMKQILEHVLDVDAAGVYRRWDDELASADESRAELILNRRISGEPFQYIVGHEWFWNSKFRVGPGVLVPRRETELLVEELLREPAPKEVRVAELGGGSGNIGISALIERPGWEWIAFEKNPESLAYLRTNRSELLPSKNNYRIVEGDFFDLAQNFAPYDWLVANPPYLSPEDMTRIPIEVTHEPRMALEGGEEGVAIIEKLLERSKDLLKPGGRFVCEIGMAQSDRVKRLFEINYFELVEVRRDYAGLPRVVQGRKAG